MEKLIRLILRIIPVPVLGSLLFLIEDFNQNDSFIDIILMFIILVSATLSAGKIYLSTYKK
ncbi:MAG: hypothetical protein K8R54_10610 [Bacteroidales bacterium]|nr:hypothetical protein [Bacteroidales bacterium]